MIMPGGFVSLSAYRFGFQGQEKDDEVKDVTGSSINYKYRIHDPRLGRFLSVDPLSYDYPWNSPYAFSENRVVDGVELEGLEFAPHGGSFNPFLIQDENYRYLYSAKHQKKMADDMVNISGTAAHAVLGAVAAPFNMISNMHYAENARRLGNEELARHFEATAKKDFGLVLFDVTAGFFISKSVIFLKSTGKSFTHLDIGGFGKYKNATNYTNTKRGYDMKGNEFDIPNLKLGNAQTTLKTVKNSSVDLVTIESAPFTDDILKETTRVLKKGGQLKIKTPRLDSDFAKIADDYGYKVGNSKTFVEDGVEYIQTSLIKQ